MAIGVRPPVTCPQTPEAHGVGVGEGVWLGVEVAVGVADAVEVADAVGVAVAPGVPVAAGVELGLGVGLGIGVGVGVGLGVAVGVAVGVPNATPDNDTFCGLFVALSLSVRVLVSWVPLGFFALIGLNVTETSQVPPPAARVAGQLFVELYTVPLVPIPLMLIATGLLLVKVTDSVLEVPT